MSFAISHYWDNGTGKPVNQDSMEVFHLETRAGEVVFACVCDGMGGHEQGETASGYTAELLAGWFYGECMELLSRHATKGQWRRSMTRCFAKVNKGLCDYGKRRHITLGTTATGILVTKRAYFWFHIGDSRLYVLRGKKGPARQVSTDHAKGPALLLRCLGINQDFCPDMGFGKVHGSRGFLLCSDGFCRQLSDRDLGEVLCFADTRQTEKGNRLLRELGERVKARGERDNLSGIYIKV